MRNILATPLIVVCVFGCAFSPSSVTVSAIRGQSEAQVEADKAECERLAYEQRPDLGPLAEEAPKHVAVESALGAAIGALGAINPVVPGFGAGAGAAMGAAIYAAGALLQVLFLGPIIGTAATDQVWEDAYVGCMRGRGYLVQDTITPAPPVCTDPERRQEFPVLCGE